MQCFLPLPACEAVHRELTRKMHLEYHERISLYHSPHPYGNEGLALVFGNACLNLNFRRPLEQRSCLDTLGTGVGGHFSLPLRYYYSNPMTDEELCEFWK